MLGLLQPKLFLEIGRIACYQQLLINDMKKGFTILFVLGIVFTVFGQEAMAQPSDYNMSRQEYIEKFKDLAIKEMHRSGVPASITLAQGILESSDGNSPLARYANNHFGIKCHAGWQGETFIQDDDTKNECFRKYNSAYDSYKDHSDFLTGRSRYAELFTFKVTDYKSWAHGLKKAGYATNPKYAHILIQIIETYDLSQYDEISKMPRQEAKTDIPRTDRLDVNDRTIKLQNNIKYTVVKKDDSFFKIASDLNMGIWQLYKYNDMKKGDNLEPGQILYLQPKRSKGIEESHVFKKGDTMWQISQMYGIRLNKLYKRNEMEFGTEPKVGQLIYLRRNKPG